MTTEDCFKKSNLLHLADAFEHKAPSPFGMHVDMRNWRGTTRTFLNLSHDRISSSIDAHCIITADDNWVMNQPEVICREHWVRRHIDWHVGEDGGLCYDLDLRWLEKVSTVFQSEGIRAAAKFAAEWCLHHTKALLWKHHYAYVHNIEKWPSDWPAWGHGDVGRMEYRSEKLFNRLKK